MRARLSPISRISRPISFALPLMLALVAACDRAPSPQGLKEWSATDHDQEQGRPSPAQAVQQVQNNVGASAGGSGASGSTVADVTWNTQCATCHGVAGHGDGPQGAMWKAPDLSREEWQSRVKDEEIAAIITGGKGRMPKFELPTDVVESLVKRVRSIRGK